jgi:hypothetical protein
VVSAVDRPAARDRRYVGPPPLAPAVLFTVLFVTSIALGVPTGAFGRPSSSAAEIARAIADSATVLRLVGMLQVGAGVALGVLTASLVAALRSRRVQVAGVQIATWGGGAAAVTMLLSGLLTWASVAAAEQEDVAAVNALRLASFAIGGPGHAVALGLLLLGVSVPAYLLRLTPRWVSVLGLVLGALAELSWFGLAADPLQFLLPAARFPALVWGIATAATILPRRPAPQP